MRKSQLRIALVVAFVAISTVAVQSALAQSSNGNAPAGWGSSQQVGSSGVSVRPELVERLENRRDRIVTRLENNNNIPEPQKTNTIDKIKEIFNKIIAFFS